MDNNTYDVISNLISLINSEVFDASILSLSENCNIPIAYTRKCILRLLNNATISACLDTDIIDVDSDVSVIETFLDDKETFTNNLLGGKYDSVIWTLNLRNLDPDDNQLLCLSPLEYSSIINLGETDTSLKHSAAYEKKDNITKIPKSVRCNQDKIIMAIENKKAITFSYRNNKRELLNKTGYPVSLFTNVSDNWIYFTLANDFPLRLDRVTTTIREVKDFAPFPDIIQNPYEKYIWGSYYSFDDKPVHVKIRICDVTTNIIQKIKNDTLHRKTTGNLYEKNGMYYYEDDIIGIGEFQRWIRGYGSSIQVIEPADLKAIIIAAAQKTLEYYEHVDEWKDL